MADQPPMPHDDFFKELLDRNMDLIARNILDHLDINSLRTFLKVSSLWKNLALQYVNGKSGHQMQYAAAKAGSRHKPFFALCVPDWYEKLKDLPHQRRQAWCILSGKEGHECTSPYQWEQTRLARPRQEGFSKKSFEVTHEGRKHLFLLNKKQRGLYDLEAKTWKWLRPNNENQVHGTTDDYFIVDFPFAGPGFVGTWSKTCGNLQCANKRIMLYSVDNGALLWNWQDRQTFMVLLSKATLVVIKGTQLMSQATLAKMVLMDEKDSSDCFYHLLQVSPDGSVHERRGWILPPTHDLGYNRNGRLDCAWFCLDDGGRYLIAATSPPHQKAERNPKPGRPKRADQFVAWDLLEPVSSSSTHVAAVPFSLTGHNSEELSVICHDVIDGKWILNICPCDDPRHDNPENPDPINDYMLCFDKCQLKLLDKLTLEPEQGSLKFETVFT